MSILDVARVAGTSHTTVSRVINGRPGVSPQAIQAVMQAIDQVGYRPPVRRRGPKPRKSDGLSSRMIGFLPVGVETAFLREPLVADILKTVEQTLRENHLGLVIGQVVNGQKLPQCIGKGMVDGLLLVGQAPTREIRQRLEGIPAVWMLTKRGTGADWGDRVRPDNVLTSVIAADYLLSKGHKHLAFVNLIPSHPAYVERGIAFKKYVEDSEARVTIFEGASTSEGFFLAAFPRYFAYEARGSNSRSLKRAEP